MRNNRGRYGHVVQWIYEKHLEKSALQHYQLYQLENFISNTSFLKLNMQFITYLLFYTSVKTIHF